MLIQFLNNAVVIKLQIKVMSERIQVLGHWPL